MKHRIIIVIALIISSLQFVGQSSLSAQSKKADECKMVIKVSGELNGVSLCISALAEDMNDVWVDINNNGVREAEDSVRVCSSAGLAFYPLASDSVVVYGKVREVSTVFTHVIDLNVSQNPYLQSLDCRLNELKSLDVSANTNLTFLDCSYNYYMNTLNVANGNNENLIVKANRTQLQCVQVDEGFVPSYQWEIANTSAWNNDSSNPCDKTGINIIETKEITVFPNPTKEYLNIASDEKIGMVQIYDMAGRKILEETGTKKISVANLPSGIYQISVVMDKKIYKQRFVKL